MSSAALGSVEGWLEWGSDFVIAPNGDLLLATDTANTTDATTQRLVRLLLTNPRVAVPGGGFTTPGDLFNPTYGAGLPASVGGMYAASSNAGLPQEIEARITSALNVDPSVQSVQSIAVTTQSAGLFVDISVTATNGQTIVLPSLPLSNLF